MKCWHFGLQRKFSLYLTGDLDPNSVRRIEDHLLDCGSCRTMLARLRNGHRLAQEMPRFTPGDDPWRSIEAAIQGDRPVARLRFADPSKWRELVLKPGFAFAIIGITALIASVIISTGKRPSGEETPQLIAHAIDRSDFHTVSIADIHENQKPHVMTEGYVSEVRVSDEGGELTFKLVDDLARPGPFIICEIIDPIKLAAPSVGSRVRVYGVSRYDGQVDHNWYEVHPVLNIEEVRH